MLSSLLRTAEVYRACANMQTRHHGEQREAREALFVDHRGRLKRTRAVGASLKYTQPVLLKKDPAVLGRLQSSAVSFQGAVLTTRACHGSVRSSSAASTETHKDIDRG